VIAVSRDKRYKDLLIKKRPKGEKRGHKEGKGLTRIRKKQGKRDPKPPRFYGILLK
jgi:hypothetical protein